MLKNKDMFVKKRGGEKEIFLTNGYHQGLDHTTGHPSTVSLPETMNRHSGLCIVTKPGDSIRN